MRIVFMGTPDFSVLALEKLAQKHEVVAVYTKEPKISGRGKKINKTPVHLLAEKLGIEVRTPKTLRNIEEQEIFKNLNADVAIVAAYGLILPQPILDAFKFGCINIHASLLPRWRGAAPIQRAIEAKDKKSGITIMKMTPGLDEGDMLNIGETPITSDTTGGLLHDELAKIGANLIIETLDNLESIIPVKQDDSLTCYAKKIEKVECLLNFNDTTENILAKINAFSPYPGMYFIYNNERFKIHKAQESKNYDIAGHIINNNNKLIITTKDSAIEVIKIQREGKQVMDITELLKGFNFQIGYQIK